MNNLGEEKYTFNWPAPVSDAEIKAIARASRIEKLNKESLDLSKSEAAHKLAARAVTNHSNAVERRASLIRNISVAPATVDEDDRTAAQRFIHAVMFWLTIIFCASVVVMTLIHFASK